jgi:ectoine hydroxylase-related dioxygenase (phytanoyl-CoA dioxygenase family)
MIRKGREKFALPDAVPAEVKPGDVLLHHTKCLHGSEVNRSGKLRRVVYFDNRAANWIRRYGWFQEPFVQSRYKLYQVAHHERRSRPYASDDETFNYTPPSDAVRWKPGEPVDLHASRGDAPGQDHEK